MRSAGIPPEKAFAQFWNHPAVQAHMTGKIDSRKFHAQAARHLSSEIAYDDFAAAWCGIFRPMPGMAALFRAVAKRLPVTILSDTDPLHWNHLSRRFPWLLLALRPTLSHETGMLKPDPRVYRLAAANAGAAPESCVFVDDMAANVAGARAAGMRAVHFTDAARLRAAFERLGVL